VKYKKKKLCNKCSQVHIIYEIKTQNRWLQCCRLTYDKIIKKSYI